MMTAWSGFVGGTSSVDAPTSYFGWPIFGPNTVTYRQDPVDGQIQHLADAQQVHEAPEDGRDERGDHDEQEPVGSAEQGRGRARHADDAKDLSREEEETRLMKGFTARFGH